MEFYKRRGYAVVAPEKHTIKEQIAYMKGADEVACTLGTLSHLALFARPGTRLACLLKSEDSRTWASAQMIVNQAKSLDFCIVDASFNFLPNVHHASHSFLLGPTRHWREYLEAAGEKCAKEELEWDASRFAYEYLLKWCEKATGRYSWVYGLARFDTFDILNSLSTVLLEKPLKREDYKVSLVDRIENKIRRMDDAKKRKVTKALWKIWRLLGERARSACIGLLSRAKK